MDAYTKFIVVRHGESDANYRNVISDKRVDHPLTARGLTQAAATAEQLKHEQIDLIVSSTRQRARDTALAINRFHHAEVILTDDLIEPDHGIFRGVERSCRQARFNQHP